MKLKQKFDHLLKNFGLESSHQRSNPSVGADSPGVARCLAFPKSVPPGLLLNKTLSAAQYSRGQGSGEYECSLFSVFEKGFGASPGGVPGGLGSPSRGVAGFSAFGGSRFAKLSGSSVVFAPAQPVVGADSPGGQRWLAGPSAVPPGLPLNSNVERCAIPAGPRLRRI